MNLERIDAAITAMSALNEQEQTHVVTELLRSDKLDMAQALQIQAKYLTQYKKDARNDMRMLSEAGLILGEKQIKAIPKSPAKDRELNAGLARTLLSGGGFATTKHHEELAKCVEGIEVNEDWYQRSWALQHPYVPKQEGGGDE